MYSVLFLLFVCFYEEGVLVLLLVRKCVFLFVDSMC